MSVALEVLPRLVLVPRCAAAAPSLSPRRCVLPALARGKEPVSLKILCKVSNVSGCGILKSG